MDEPIARALLLDLDGVLHVGDDVIDGSLEAIAALRGAGVPLRFVTNTTSKPRSAVVGRLAAMGFDVVAAEVLTPAALAVQHCREKGHTRVRLLVRDALREDLDALTDAGDDVDAVILGDLGDGFTYATLNAAFGLLREGAELIALQRNRTFQSEHGLLLDVGPFVAALEYAAGVEATVVGKPSGDFFAAALADLGVAASEAAMVGDDVEADVGGALDAGLSGVLVRTGKFREDTLASSGVEPTAVVDALRDVPALFGIDG